MDSRKPSKGKCHSVARVTARVLLSFLAMSTTSPVAASWGDSWMKSAKQAPLLPVIPPTTVEGPEDPRAILRDHDFTLRHVFLHGTYSHPNTHRRLDLQPTDATRIVADSLEIEDGTGTLKARSNPLKIQRLVDRRTETVEPLLRAARYWGRPPSLPTSAWTTDEIPGPDIKDKETVVNLAVMAANAYVRIPGTEDWEDTKQGYNQSQGVGWEGDGLRGHIFADKDNSTIVIAIKGTSPAVFDGEGTTTNDKLNDNLFFSCCCGQGGQYLWHEVCSCMTSAYSCNETCIVKALKGENVYYRASIELYNNVSAVYPTSNIWLVGHSLGGAVSSFLGQTFGLPVVTYESPPDAIAAARLGLPAPPGAQASAPQTKKDTGAFHFGHNADPVYMGACNGATAACTLGGYAFETQCHTGMRCVYDVVGDYSWRMSITYHKIRGVIRDILKVYDTVPDCVPDDECVDCFNWKRYYSNGSDHTTTTSKMSTTTSQTRTQTCKTPGWWGCLDESTTTTTTSTTSSITTTTVTCTKYGWFGNCLDPSQGTSTSTTTTGTTPTPTAILTKTTPPTPPNLPSPKSPSQATLTTSTTATCSTPGHLWGCKDRPSTSSTSSTTTTTCFTPGLIWGCQDEKTTTSTIPVLAHEITVAPLREMR
ncbi:MAG: putative lipase atg15 [Icmadophila ericetorum]|nr:putative lipase atg15 [Icmadophila ericetorum]